MTNLACTCKWNGNRLDKVSQLELEVLRVRKELCGPKHREIVDALTELAETYRYRSKYMGLQNLLIEALDMITSLVGRAHSATISIMKQLAGCYTSSHDVEVGTK